MHLSGKKLHSEQKNTKENNPAAFAAVLRDVLDVSAIKKPPTDVGVVEGTGLLSQCVC